MIVNKAEIRETDPIVKECDELPLWKTVAQKLALEMENQVRLFSGVYNGMSDGLLLVDLTGKIRFVNRQFLKIICCDGRDFIGASMEVVFTPELFRGQQMFNFSTVQEAAAAKTGRKYAGVEIMVRGGTIFVDWKIQPLCNNKGQVACVAIYCRENGGAQLLAEEMAKNEALTKVGQLAAGVAHEVRNPLQTVGGLMDVLRTKYEDDSNIRRYSDIISGEVKRINDILTEFLKFSRPQKIDRAMKNLNDICDEVIILMVSLANLNGVRLTKEFAETIPDIYLDEYKIKQVLINLITNGIDAAKCRADGEICINTCYEPKTKELYIRVADNGCGIPQDTLPKIFNTFFTTKEHGTGLGLPICNQIIAEHGGRLTVESTEGQGTVFTVMIPDKVALDQERA